MKPEQCNEKSEGAQVRGYEQDEARGRKREGTHVGGYNAIPSSDLRLRQNTNASRSEKELSHTVPQLPFTDTSTRLPSAKRTVCKATRKNIDR